MVLSPPSVTLSPEPPSSSNGDSWHQIGNAWVRVHIGARTSLFDPSLDQSTGPDPTILSGHRRSAMHMEDGTTRDIEDDWRKPIARSSETGSWTGLPTLRTASPMEDDVHHSRDDEVSGARGTDHPEDRAIDRTRPWDGPSPPDAIGVYKGPFVRRADGIWCRPDASGRLYPVDAGGERWFAPKEKSFS